MRVAVVGGGIAGLAAARRLEALDAELARLEGHLARPARSLPVMRDGSGCCDAASAVAEGCACCARELPLS